MSYLRKILWLLLVFQFQSGCRKSTDMEVHVINPALDMVVPGATVVLVERKGSGSAGIFGGSAECKEIATAITDDHGRCSFSQEKLKNKKQVVYFLSLKKSWDVDRVYTPAVAELPGLWKKVDQKAI